MLHTPHFSVAAQNSEAQLTAPEQRAGAEAKSDPAADVPEVRQAERQRAPGNADHQWLRPSARQGTEPEEVPAHPRRLLRGKPLGAGSWKGRPGDASRDPALNDYTF